MNRIIKNLIILLLGFVIVIGGVLGISYLTTQYDPESCKNVVHQYREKMQAVCPAEYLEWGYDTPEQCVNDEMGMYDPRACM